MALADVFHQHNMKDFLDRRDLLHTTRSIPKIICSEALV